MDQAVGDLEHARSDRERGFYEWACFSAQQAAEKAVKAVFQKTGVEDWGRSMREADRLIRYAEEIVDFCARLLSEI